MRIHCWKRVDISTIAVVDPRWLLFFFLSHQENHLVIFLTGKTRGLEYGLVVPSCSPCDATSRWFRAVVSGVLRHGRPDQEDAGRRAPAVARQGERSDADDIHVMNCDDMMVMVMVIVLRWYKHGSTRVVPSTIF